MNSYSHWLIILCVAIVAGLAAGLFLPSQSIWTDEVTQLTGLALPTPIMMQWLLHHTSDFGVPFDRMPPLSYLAFKGWGALFGQSITSYRWMGVLCISLASALLSYTALRHCGKRAALIAGLLFALSPNVIVMAVEIRAYPLFLLLSCAAFYFASIRSFVGLVIACVLMQYTHFFGVVCTVSLLLSLWIAEPAKRRALTISCLAIVVFSMGLIPFVIAAMELSQANSGGFRAWSEIARLGFRLAAHAALSVHPIVLWSLLAIFLFLLETAWQSRQAIVRDATATLIVGFTLVTGATFALHGFESASPVYNCWMLPPFFILLGAAVRKNRAILLLGTLAVLLQAIGAYQLIVNGPYFAHGPYEKLAAWIDAEEVPTAIVYEKSDQAGMAYFALNYLCRSPITHFLEPPAIDALSQYPRVIVINAEKNSHQELLQQIRQHAVRSLVKGALFEQLEHSSHWQLVQDKTFPAWTSVNASVFLQSTVSLP